MSLVTTYRSSRELFVNLTLRELRSKYKRSFLGWAWSMLNPLATMAVYTIVFRLFFRAQPPPGVHGLNQYSLFLMCALLPWNFFASSVMGSIGSLVANGSLIKKTYFQRRLLPASNVGANMVSHLIEMGLLTAVLLGFGDWEAVAFIPITLIFMCVMAMFAFGMGMLFSALNVYFRDIEHLMTIVLLVWVYLTPVIYPITTAGVHRYITLLKINPMTEMTDCFRAVMYYGRFPTAAQFGYFLAAALISLVVGWIVFGRLQDQMAEEL
jgi:ABC-type polysaccharide/polyol phosphate export permease